LLRERFDRDALTDLPLRRPFLERLGRSMAESLRHSRPLTVALLDVDFFKRVNDQHGHQTGDHVLSSLARLLSARLRAEDLRGRWGGEEFVLAFPGDAGEVQRTVGDILMEFGNLAFRDGFGKAFSVTFSAGTATYPADGASVQALLETADRRLYLAKRNGRARVVSKG
jgi:diguanylate cyclase (GGDEF)-like protein